MGKSALIWLYNISRFDCIYLIIDFFFFINQFELLIIALSLTIKQLKKKKNYIHYILLLRSKGPFGSRLQLLAMDSWNTSFIQFNYLRI